MFRTYRKYYSFLLRYKWRFSLFLLTMGTATILDSIQPYFYKLFIDTSPQKNYTTALYILVAYLVVRLFKVAFDNIKELFGDSTVISAARDARLAVFRQVHDLDFAYHMTKSTGSLISAFKRGDNAFYDIFDALNNRLYGVLISFVVTLYFFYTISPTLALGLLFSLVLNLFIASWLIKSNLRAREEFNNAEDQISGLITDNLLNFDTVKLFAKETWEYRRLTDELKSWYSKFWHFANSFRAIDITVGTLGNIGLFLILLRALQSTAIGVMPLSNYIMVVGFIANFYPRFFELIWQLRRIAKNQIDMDKYLKILDQPVTVIDPIHPKLLSKSTGHITLDHVSFNYPATTVPVLSDINLDIPSGQSIAFVGHSGAGKTSLIKLLMRFYDVASGSITIDGIDIRDLTKSHLRSFMGVVPQDPIMFNDTLKFNIAYGANDPSHANLLQAVDMAHLTEFVNSLPEGFNTQVGERGIKLSGGQKQRLAIARMILSNPDIIIFDEATSQLDSESEQKIQSAFWTAAQGKTTLIIAHRLSTVMRADKIVVMQDGKIVETGTHAKLIQNKKSLYSRFWKIQTEPVMFA